MPRTGEPADDLDVLLTDPRHLRREAVRRKKPFDEKVVTQDDLPEYLADGWVTDRATGKKTKIKRQKQIGERLENRFWMFLYRLGYPEMNAGKSFTAVIRRKGADDLRKQIDVFAKDDETVVVAECKASEKVAKKSLQKDVEEFANLKGPIAHAINSHYGPTFKPKIIWLFVTENIVWSKQDKDRAAGEKIRIVTERELRYYSQISDHLGKAARYQFLAEFLKDQEIPELKGNSVPAIRGKLGGKRFYSFVTRPRDLLKIAFVNHRSLNDPEGAPTYQRLVSKARLREIGKFIEKGGFFPTNILINFTRPVRFDKISHEEGAGVTYGQLYLPDRYRSAWVIDGQHRLYGFSPIDDSFLDQNIMVVAFEQLPKEEEANLFVTINHEQRSVPKNLLEDLEGELRWGSDVPSERIGAIASRLINCLNADIGDPFHGRVTQQGIPSTNKTCLTIPALKDALRRARLLGSAVMNTKIYEPGPLSGTNDFETLDKARCALNQYFGRIRTANLDQWERGREGYLCTNVAAQAYLLLLAALIAYMESNTALDSRELSAEEVVMEIDEFFQPILDVLSQSDAQEMEARFKVPFGSGGPPEYYYRLCRIIKARYADFEPEGMDQWETEQSEENISSADRQIREIVTAIQKHLFTVLRSVHGEERDAYWHKGVTDKDIKTKGYQRSLDDDDDRRLPLENYLDVIEYKKIIESKPNWPLMSRVFNIPEPGVKGQAKNLKWMERINELRRISAHPGEKRLYKAEDFAYIDYIHGELKGRIQAADAHASEVPPGVEVGRMDELAADDTL